jgi:hypothetical protein
MLSQEFRQKFLTNTDDSGRFIVSSPRTGKTYYVEPVDARNKTDWTDWGSIDPATGKMMNKPGFRKYAGAVSPKESLITKENGFSKVHDLEPGLSPLAYIDMLDAKYPDKE